MKQIREPGAGGSYLKDSEKSEMYWLHKEIPGVYTVETLAKDYSIMRQRVHAILWLKEIEEKEEKKLGHPLDQRRPSEGWKFTVEKLGENGRRGGGGWKFVSLPDESSRPLDEIKKMYVRREIPRRRHKIVP
ncbi:hypothetical protein Peur_026012 [Populus x canadensis]